MATGIERTRTGTSAARAPAGKPRQAATAASKPRSRRRWFMVAMCFFGLTINYVDRSNLSVALPKMKTALHLVGAFSYLVIVGRVEPLPVD